jgi:hypothetical protein
MKDDNTAVSPVLSKTALLLQLWLHPHLGDSTADRRLLDSMAPDEVG